MNILYSFKQLTILQLRYQNYTSHDKPTHIVQTQDVTDSRVNDYISAKSSDGVEVSSVNVDVTNISPVVLTATDSADVTEDPGPSSSSRRRERKKIRKAVAAAKRREIKGDRPIQAPSDKDTDRSQRRQALSTNWPATAYQALCSANSLVTTACESMFKSMDLTGPSTRIVEPRVRQPPKDHDGWSKIRQVDRELDHLLHKLQPATQVLTRSIDKLASVLREAHLSYERKSKLLQTPFASIAKSARPHLRQMAKEWDWIQNQGQSSKDGDLHARLQKQVDRFAPLLSSVPSSGVDRYHANLELGKSTLNMLRATRLLLQLYQPAVDAGLRNAEISLKRGETIESYPDCWVLAAKNFVPAWIEPADREPLVETLYSLDLWKGPIPASMKPWYRWW